MIAKIDLLSKIHLDTSGFEISVFGVELQVGYNPGVR